ncbi:MAG: barstar family protein [Cellulomonas sp.]|nr:barstar family protein [Cellulomonas sp.]
MDLARVHDRDGLAELLARTFMFPHETRGLDAAIDLISDLEWFGNPAGYLIIVEGMDRAREIVATFARMLPNIVDRWRSQGGIFVVVLKGAESSREAASALASANSALEAAGQLPWAQPGTGAVTVVDHTLETP